MPERGLVLPRSQAKAARWPRIAVPHASEPPGRRRHSLQGGAEERPSHPLRWPKVTRPLGTYHPRRRGHPEPPPTFEASAGTPPDYKPPVPGLQHDPSRDVHAGEPPTRRPVPRHACQRPTFSPQGSLRTCTHTPPSSTPPGCSSGRPPHPSRRASARRSPHSVVSPCPRHEVKPSKHCSRCGSLRTCAGTTHSPQRRRSEETERAWSGPL